PGPRNGVVPDLFHLIRQCRRGICRLFHRRGRLGRVVHLALRILDHHRRLVDMDRRTTDLLVIIEDIIQGHGLTLNETIRDEVVVDTITDEGEVTVVGVHLDDLDSTVPIIGIQIHPDLIVMALKTTRMTAVVRIHHPTLDGITVLRPKGTTLSGSICWDWVLLLTNNGDAYWPRLRL
ncbi:hypothetical protein IWQ62_006299, partial [Dispira parvispora]